MPEQSNSGTGIVTQQGVTRRWRSNLRHGLRTRKLPFQGGESIARYRNQFRRQIEDELLLQRREIGVAEATIVAAAVVAYEYALKAGFWLANNHDELNHDQRLTHAREEMNGMTRAAQLLKQLGIERDLATRNPWATLANGPLLTEPPVQASRGAEPATEPTTTATETPQ